MSVAEDDLAAIAAVARETSIRGAGISLKDALERARYRELRPELRRQQLEAYFGTHPETIEEWLRYSEDKRTEGGWYLTTYRDAWQVGRVSALFPHSYDSAARACSEYVLRELDFWINLK